MKLRVEDIGGEVVKDNETYLLRDNTHLKNLVVSTTDLKSSKSTRGHSHTGQEEVYYFIKGWGTMELDDNSFPVGPGDVVLIEDGVFHRVHAGPTGCYFMCVFDGKSKR